ncbi:hypothetical protein [Nocardia testacea]|uniref:Uncharacterized protein n=1 Tax=Nocardia testacea TaxID=248551 RepID=A0ABW7VW77_9NOCA
MNDGIIRAMREVLRRAKKIIPDVANLRSRPPRSAGDKAKGAVNTVGDTDRVLREPIEDNSASGADHRAISARNTRIVTGLGDDIDDLAVSSRSLSRDIRRLQEQDWKFERGGLDAYTDYSNKTITVPDAEVIDIEEGYSEIPIGPTEMTRHLAQQVEYAQRSSLTDLIAPPGLDELGDRTGWVERQVQKLVARDTASYLAAARARREIWEQSGIDIDENHSHDPITQEAQNIERSMSWHDGVRELSNTVGDQPFPESGPFGPSRREDHTILVEQMWEGFRGQQGGL